jgi:hypothetical protein
MNSFLQHLVARSRQESPIRPRTGGRFDADARRSPERPEDPVAPDLPPLIPPEMERPPSSPPAADQAPERQGLGEAAPFVPDSGSDEGRSPPTRTAVSLTGPTPSTRPADPSSQRRPVEPVSHLTALPASRPPTHPWTDDPLASHDAAPSTVVRQEPPVEAPESGPTMPGRRLWDDSAERVDAPPVASAPAPPVPGTEQQGVREPAVLIPAISDVEVTQEVTVTPDIEGRDVDEIVVPPPLAVRPDWPPPARPSRRDAPSHPQTVQVTIGRVEVRAVFAPPPAAPPPPPPGPVMSLDDYLHQRDAAS